MLAAIASIECSPKLSKGTKIGLIADESEEWYMPSTNQSIT